LDAGLGQQGTFDITVIDSNEGKLKTVVTAMQRQWVTSAPSVAGASSFQTYNYQDNGSITRGYYSRYYPAAMALVADWRAM